ncbi:class I SAM-dependent methyltransferase [Streptomyces sp. NPDC012693]|uniref:class I SAM-dependent methyltransferase n=1 Tax=Streptomyces sp. NPDC012693 TaxID=3364844 RepID=UPI0036803121
MTVHANSGANLLTDHPELYEKRFPDPDRLAARWTEETLTRYGSGPRVLDVGCGTGRDAAWLHGTAGRDVTGIDTSEAMLAHARAHHPGPAHRRADMRDFDLGTVFDAVVCLDSALLYCHTNDDLTAFLARCRTHLAPGGLLVAEMRNGAFFLGSTELLDGPRTASFAWRGTTYTSRTTLGIDHGAQLLRRRRVWTADDGSAPEEQRSAWRLLFPQELRHFLTTAGFEVLALHDGPGPRTEPPWSEGAVPYGTARSDRLHLVARLLSPPARPGAPTPSGHHHSNGDSTS